MFSNSSLIYRFCFRIGLLVQLLIHTGVTRYLEFKCIEGSYVYKGSKIHKVPADQGEALSSRKKKSFQHMKSLPFFSFLALMGLLEKRRFGNMLVWANDYDEKEPKTQKNIPPTMNMIDAFKKFSLDQDTIDFTGHAIALYSDDEYDNKTFEIYKKKPRFKFIVIYKSQSVKPSNV